MLILTLLSTFAGVIFDYNNLAGPGPASPAPESRKTVLGFGHGNSIATGAIILITLLNIAVYILRVLYEANLGEDLDMPSLLQPQQLCRRFSLGEILSATGNFDDSSVIGRGGFGKVYKGVIDINGPTTVAIKRLNPMSKQGAPEFWTEIEMLSKFRHSHLVSLIGYCDSHNEMVLVYDYMIRGTLADHLHKIDKNDNNSSLSWVRRLRICIGAARGLDYLHTGTGIQHIVIHRDVKSTNILLDENWEAKISDFGLSKIGPADQTCTHVSTNKVKGTIGYLDPEYFMTHRFTRKSDVYAFGVVLFEVLCERPAVDLSLDEEQMGLARWARQCIKDGKIEHIIGPSLKWQILPRSLIEFVQIADQCLRKRPKKRPTMAEVVAKLEFALTLQVSTDSSIIEGDIINMGGAFDEQDDAESYPEIPEDKQIDEIIQVADSSGRQSLKKPKMTFTRKVRLFFSRTTPEGKSKLILFHFDVH